MDGELDRATGLVGAPTRSLSGFTGSGYDKGRGIFVQILWLIVSGTIAFRWWMPNAARLAILRGFGAKLESGVLIRHNVRIHWPWKLTVGADSWIGDGVWILNLEPVVIGHDVCVSQDAMICTGSHDRRSRTFEFDNAPIFIEDGAWVATRATVLRGVRLGRNCTIAAGSVVTQDVPEGSLHLGSGGRT